MVLLYYLSQFIRYSIILLSCFRYFDLKKIIAFSSILHLNLVLVSCLSFNSCGLLSGIFISLSHSFSSPIKAIRTINIKSIIIYIYINHISYYVSYLGMNYNNVIGFLLFIIFVIQFVSGLLLSCYYSDYIENQIYLETVII